MTRKGNQAATMSLLAVILLSYILVIVCESGVQFTTLNADEIKSCENRVKNGDVVHILYRGSLTETGEVFDQSQSVDSPLIFQIGVGMVIPGLEQGMMGMCELEVRQIVIPPELAYGDVAIGKIPAKSSLTFEVLLAKIGENKPAHPQYQMQSVDWTRVFVEYWWAFALVIVGLYLYRSSNQKKDTSSPASPPSSSPSPSSNSKKNKRK